MRLMTGGTARSAETATHFGMCALAKVKGKGTSHRANTEDPYQESIGILWSWNMYVGRQRYFERGCREGRDLTPSIGVLF